MFISFRPYIVHGAHFIWDYVFFLFLGVCVVLCCLVFLVRHDFALFFSNFSTSFTDNDAIAERANLITDFFLFAFPLSLCRFGWFFVYRLVARLNRFMWMDFICLLCILVCTSISKCQYNFQFSYDFRPFMSLALTAFVHMLVYLSGSVSPAVCVCVYETQYAVHICPLKLHSFHHFHTFFPFRYLFNLIWFHFLAAFFHSHRPHRRETQRYFHRTCLFLFRASPFPTMQFRSCHRNVLLNYLKLIKPRTWIDFFFVFLSSLLVSAVILEKGIPHILT